MRVRYLACVGALIPTLIGAPADALTSATWLGGAGVWSDASHWSSDPLAPCNGNGGESFDVSIPNGAVTLDLDCTVETVDLSGGALDGAFTLTANQPSSWENGTLAGSATTRVLGGLALSTTANKSFADTHRLEIAGGTATWSAGSIYLGVGGATLQNQVGASLTVTGGSGRLLYDGNDTGTLANEGTFTLALDAPANLLTVSPGAFTQSGALHVNTGILALNTSGAHPGSFDGAGTLRFAGGSQALLSGASVTVADLEVTGGSLTVQPGASLAVGNLDQSSGTLTLTDAGTTATATTGTQSGGTLAGAGSLEVAGLLTWSAGTRAGSATTRALGGLALSATATKSFADTHRLEIAGGAATWSAGSINLGVGGATLQNQVGASLTVTGGSGRLLYDGNDTGTFANEGTFTLALDAPANALTLSPGTILNSGLLDLVTGSLHLQTSFTQTAGAIRLSGGSLTATSPLDVQGGSLAGTGLIQADVQCAGVIAPGLSAGQLEIDGELTLLPGGELRAELGGLAQGTEYDFVPVSGSAALAGSLSATFLSGFEGAVDPGDAFTILESTSAAPLTGAFANVASGERVIGTPGLGSLVVSYGSGSTFGAERVVLHDFRAFTPVAVFQVGGVAQGGTLTLNVAGVEIVVPTADGQTAEQVADAIAAAILESSSLARGGIAAVATGTTVSINAGIQGDVVVDDPGLVISPVQNVPSLPGPALVVVAAALAATGALSRRLSPPGSSRGAPRRAAGTRRGSDDAAAC